MEEAGASAENEENAQPASQESSAETEENAQPASPESSAETPQVLRTAVATKNINMRTEPKETAEKIMTVVGSETVEVLSEANGWAQIRYKNKVGFVKADLIY